MATEILGYLRTEHYATTVRYLKVINYLSNKKNLKLNLT